MRFPWNIAFLASAIPCGFFAAVFIHHWPHAAQLAFAVLIGWAFGAVFSMGLMVVALWFERNRVAAADARASRSGAEGALPVSPESPKDSGAGGDGVACKGVKP